MEQPAEYKRRKQEERVKDWSEKELNWQYIRQTRDVAGSESWSWLKVNELKEETEGLIMAAQYQALRTNVIKAQIEHQVSALCRICGKSQENVEHVVRGCSKLAQRDYKKRHDTLTRVVHWELCKMYDLPYSSKWYEHGPEGVTENERVIMVHVNQVFVLIFLSSLCLSACS